MDGLIHNRKDIYSLDIHKQELLEKKGIQVVRILNQDITDNIDQTMLKIKNKLT